MNYKINIPKSIILLIIFSIILNILRIIIWNKFSFVWVLWNIFLAILPFFVSSLLLKFNSDKSLSNSMFIIGGIIWLLLIPNAPYIITDLVHIGEIRAVPALYDSFLMFSSALAGLLLGAYSINHMEIILKTKYSRKISNIILLISIFFISFGMYLGRFLRFNSWDVFARPNAFIIGIKEIFMNTSNLVEAFIFTLLFFTFMLIYYISWKSTQIK
jgi:uncharacterized membrane protein